MKLHPVIAKLLRADKELIAASCNCVSAPKNCMLQPGWHMYDQHMSFSQNHLSFHYLLFEKMWQFAVLWIDIKYMMIYIYIHFTMPNNIFCEPYLRYMNEIELMHWWNVTNRRKLKYSKRNSSSCHFVHHKTHMDLLGIKHGLLQ